MALRSLNVSVSVTSSCLSLKFPSWLESKYANNPKTSVARNANLFYYFRLRILNRDHALPGPHIKSRRLEVICRNYRSFQKMYGGKKQQIFWNLEKYVATRNEPYATPMVHPALSQ